MTEKSSKEQVEDLFEDNKEIDPAMICIQGAYALGVKGGRAESTETITKMRELLEWFVRIGSSGNPRPHSVKKMMDDSRTLLSEIDKCSPEQEM